MLFSIVLSVANACFLRAYGGLEMKKPNVYLFNAGISFVWIMILLALFGISDNTWDPVAIFYGAIYGVILFAFLLFKTQAMANGPIALSTLIGSCAFVIATAFGVLYCEETVLPAQLMGMLLLFVSLILCVNPKKSKEKLTVKWMLYSLGFFMAGGGVGILYKMFGKSEANTECETMLLTAAIVSFVIFLTVGFMKSDKKHELIKPDKKVGIYILLSGIASCSYIRLNLSLSNRIPSVIFFPVSNGGMVILSTIAGTFLFHEKLTKRQFMGIAIGCVAVIIVGCGDFLLGQL